MRRSSGLVSSSLGFGRTDPIRTSAVKMKRKIGNLLSQGLLDRPLQLNPYRNPLDHYYYYYYYYYYHYYYYYYYEK